MGPRVFEGGMAPSPAPAAKAKPAKEDVDMAQIGIYSKQEQSNGNA